MGAGDLPGLIGQLLQAIEQLSAQLSSFLHLNQVIAAMLNDSLGLVLTMWSDFVLKTTDVEARGGPFTANATIQLFEPVMQKIADAALVLAAIWASYRIMWGHGVRSQFTARVLLPRLIMGAVLINFSMPMFQAAVDINNTVADVAFKFGNVPDWGHWIHTFSINPYEGIWEVLTSSALVVGYDVLAVAYLIRYTVLIFLAISAPLAGLLFVLPDTNHLAKLWRKLFITNLFMQPVQLFVLSIGFALDQAGHTPVHHLFALVSLLIVFKVPGAMGSAEKIAHKLESTAHTGLSHVEHAVLRAV